MGGRVRQRDPRDLAAVPAAGGLSTARYDLRRLAAPAGELHSLAVPDPPAPQVWWLEPLDTAFVLGSSQDERIVDRDVAHRGGVNIVRRRSGGGAVLLVPDEVVWFDVILPAGAPGWSDDVHRPMRWLGEHLAAALRTVDPSLDLEVHRGALQRTAWSATLCWAGLGPGEISRRGRKLVGISQRRTRAAARLQCSWYRTDPTVRSVELLAERPAIGEPPMAATLPALDAAAALDALRSRLDAELRS